MIQFLDSIQITLILALGIFIGHLLKKWGESKPKEKPDKRTLRIKTFRGPRKDIEDEFNYWNNKNHSEIWDTTFIHDGNPGSISYVYIVEYIAEAPILEQKPFEDDHPPYNRV